MGRPKVYIAGPEVFMEDGKQVSERYVALCEQYGFEGFSPALGHGDPIDFSNPDRKQIAKEICEKNMRLIEQCDLIIANLNEFRGDEPDGGTAFEVGYGYGLEKKLYGFLTDMRPHYEKYRGERTTLPDGREADFKGRWFETDCLNLMLFAPSTIISGGFEDALKAAAKDYFGEGK